MLFSARETGTWPLRTSGSHIAVLKTQTAHTAAEQQLLSSTNHQVIPDSLSTLHFLTCVFSVKISNQDHGQTHNSTGNLYSSAISQKLTDVRANQRPF